MKCAGCDEVHGLPNCQADIGESPLIRLESEVAMLGFCSNGCRNRWEHWVNMASGWEIVAYPPEAKDS